jgi:hypothetical protein
MSGAPYLCGLFLRTAQKAATATTSTKRAGAKISTPRYPEPPEWVDVVLEEGEEDELVLELPDV